MSEENRKAFWGVVGFFAVLVVIGLLPTTPWSTPMTERTITDVKETAVMIATAYKSQTISADTSAHNFEKYFNYVKVNSTASFEFFNCADKNIRCLELSTGGLLAFKPGQKFSAVDTTRYLTFNFDRDAAGPEQPLSFLLFDNGRLTLGSAANHGIPGPGGIEIITKDPDYMKI